MHPSVLDLVKLGGHFRSLHTIEMREHGLLIYVSVTCQETGHQGFRKIQSPSYIRERVEVTGVGWGPMKYGGWKGNEECVCVGSVVLCVLW